METTTVELDRERARQLWRDYRAHQHYSQPIDEDVMRTYHAIAQGRVVIRAVASVIAAGLNADGLPKLAIARADKPWCWIRAEANGSGTFTTNEAETWAYRERRGSRQRIDFPANSFAFPKTRRAKSMVPQIPLPLRPKRGLANYHVLYEAEWNDLPPVDPMLLRRVGRADLWIVCAAWELTEVERAALAARLHA